jgi:hypothetical protein
LLRLLGSRTKSTLTRVRNVATVLAARLIRSSSFLSLASGFGSFGEAVKFFSQTLRISVRYSASVPTCCGRPRSRSICAAMDGMVLPGRSVVHAEASDNHG